MTAKKKNTAMAKVARLDADRVYHGIDEIPEKDVTDAHVRLDGGCDLPPGRYRHDPVSGAFVPLHRQDSPKDMPPDALPAIALGLAAAHMGGIAMPQPTLDWLDFFFESVDGRDMRHTADSFISRNKG